MKKVQKIFLVLFILSTIKILLSQQLSNGNFRTFIESNFIAIKILFISSISLGCIHLNEPITDYLKGSNKTIFSIYNIAFCGIVLISIIVQ
jgi:hypothetical protein